MFSDLVTDDILDVLKRTCVVLGRSSQNVIVQKRQKSLRDGDFCVPKGCFQINMEVYKVFNIWHVHVSALGLL